MPRDISSTIIKRKTIYAFLKRIYEKELSREFLAEMPTKMKPLLAIAETLSRSEAKKAVKELVQFTDKIDSHNLDDLQIQLAADYARLFLSINKIPPHPSESVYREGTMMQYYRDEVLKVYWSFGVGKKKEFTEPEDHIAVELSFMMYLCEKAIDALKKGNTEGFRKYIHGQNDFLEDHLARWVPKLVKDVVDTAKMPFYRAIAILTREYIDMDSSIVRELLGEFQN
jgi:TorA maturation chaperone TorD